mmetsp:Transcript_72773/g.210694  ORF Transcript_72773/g.210694 Transcript_72773/m.210694 type:complete len:282 (+) Transcript_72773:994-1839(+)
MFFEVAPTSSALCAPDKAPGALFFGKRMENNNCRFSWQNFFDTVMYLQRLIAPRRRKTGSDRMTGSSKHAKSKGFILSSKLFGPKTTPDSASSMKASFSRSSWPTPPILVASLVSSSSSSLLPFLPFLPFFAVGLPPLFLSRCFSIRASSSARRFLFKADCNASKYTSILSAKCPATKTAHPSCGAATFGETAWSSLSASRTATASPAPSAPSLPSGAAHSSPPSQMGAIGPMASSVVVDRPRTLASMRASTCSQNLSGHCCSGVLAFGAMDSSKDKSIAA